MRNTGYCIGSLIPEQLQESHSPVAVCAFQAPRSRRPLPPRLVAICGRLMEPVRSSWLRRVATADMQALGAAHSADMPRHCSVEIAAQPRAIA